MRYDCGQSPDDIIDRRGWIYLGGPGWWGSIPLPRIVAIKKYLSELLAIPSHPNEWITEGLGLTTVTICASLPPLVS